MKFDNLVPALFVGSPVSLVASALLVHVVPGVAALAVGVAVGMCCGRTLLRAFSKPASQRS